MWSHGRGGIDEKQQASGKGLVYDVIMVLKYKLVGAGVIETRASESGRCEGLRSVTSSGNESG